jgi:CubicO group peptidase (beta-lactamase class C family)
VEAVSIKNDSFNNSSSSPKFADVSRILTTATADGAFGGAVLVVGKKGKVLYSECVGVRSSTLDKEHPPLPTSLQCVFDIGALTGSIATTTLLMKLVEIGKLRLEDRIAQYIQGFGVFGKSLVTVGEVLCHISGLPHWHPYYEELIKENAGARMGILTSRGARDYIVNAINRSQLKNPPGTKQGYSDLGFLLLGNLVEVLTALPLDRALSKFITTPLGLSSTSFIDLQMVKRRGLSANTDVVVPTEECPWRKRLLWGEVHDDNAWAMGGVAGHSGVFSSAPDLHILATTLIESYHGRSPFLNASVVKRFWRGPEDLENSVWRYGWEAPSKENGLAEVGFSPAAVGQHGFTGCSLWIDPQKELDIVLLTNRVHPTRTNKRLQAIRPELFGAILQAAK